MLVNITTKCPCVGVKHSRCRSQKEIQDALLLLYFVHRGIDLTLQDHPRDVPLLFFKAFDSYAATCEN